MIQDRQLVLDRTVQSLEHEMVVMVYQMELDRANFLLASYLRTRLKKIEKYILHIMTSDRIKKTVLSEQELVFAEGYYKIMEQHLHALYLDGIPEKFRSFLGSTVGQLDRAMIPEPDLKGKNQKGAKLAGAVEVSAV